MKSKTRNKKVLRGILLMLLILFVSTEAVGQGRYMFGNVILMDTNSGSLKVTSGDIITDNHIRADNYYIGVHNKGVLNSEPINGDITISNSWDVATPEMRFWVELSNGSFRWLLNSGVTQMTLDVTNGLRVYDNLRADSLFVTSPISTRIESDEQVVNTDAAYLRIDSNDPTPTDRTFTLSNGTYAGQHLFIEFYDDTNQAELIDTGTQHLNGNFTFDNLDESLTLIWNGTAWIERCRVDN